MNLKIVSNFLCYADKINMEPSCLLGDYRTSICVKYPWYWNSSDSQVSTLIFCECKLTDSRPVSLDEFSQISSTKSTSFLIKVRKIWNFQLNRIIIWFLYSSRIRINRSHLHSFFVFELFSWFNLCRDEQCRFGWLWDTYTEVTTRNTLTGMWSRSFVIIKPKCRFITSTQYYLYWKESEVFEFQKNKWWDKVSLVGVNGLKGSSWNTLELSLVGSTNSEWLVVRVCGRYLYNDA